MKTVWQVKGLHDTHYKLIWWLVDAGAVGRVLARGWQERAAGNLGIHRITLWRAMDVLIEHKIAQKGYLKGDITLNIEAFAKSVDIEGLKFRGKL